MKTPFPGMDPWLEHPALWPDVHNSLIAAIRDELSPRVAPDFVVRLEQRTYIVQQENPIFLGRPDLVVASGLSPSQVAPAIKLLSEGLLEIDLARHDQIEESYLEIRDVKTRSVVTVIEVLSPTNKLDIEARRQYLQKRLTILGTLTNLIEIDLLRAGEPMDINVRERGDYRILISRGFQRSRSHLYFFSLRNSIPSIPVPLLPGLEEPRLNLNQLVHDLYTRARFDLTLDYHESPLPPLSEEDAAWANKVLEEHKSPK